LRAHVLFFDEYYQEHHDYRFRDVMRAAEEASLMLFVGTSFSVGITDMLLRVAYQHQTPTFSIDPGGSRIPAYYRVTAIPEPAESVLPDTIQLLAG
jgi:NAD-dependent deacetylase